MRSPGANRWLPLIYLVILGAGWGLHFSLIKIAAESGLSYSGIAAITTGGVASLLLIIAAIRRRPTNTDATHLRFYFICAVLGYVIPFFLELYSAAHLSASVLTLVISSTPLFTVALAIAVRSDTVTARRMLGIGAGAVSVALLLVPAVVGLADQSVFALLLLVPVYLWTGDTGGLFGSFGAGHLAIVVMVVLSVIEIFLYFEIVRFAGPIFVSQASYVTVVTGVFWGMIIFGERPSEWLWMSAALLGLALYFVARETVADLS